MGDVAGREAKSDAPGGVATEETYGGGALRYNTVKLELPDHIRIHAVVHHS